MRAQFLHIAALTLAVVLAASAFAQQKRGPSTAEERTKAVQFARDLESNPLSSHAKAEREWFTLWLIDVPDITVEVCSRLLGPEIPDRKKFGTEIFSQLMFSEAAFIIENSDRAKDGVAVRMAGVAGALKVYEAILKEHPKAQLKALDEIIARRDKGELQSYVQETMKYCTKKVS